MTTKKTNTQAASKLGKQLSLPASSPSQGAGRGTQSSSLHCRGESKASTTAASFNPRLVDVGVSPGLEAQQCVFSARAGSRVALGLAAVVAEWGGTWGLICKRGHTSFTRVKWLSQGDTWPQPQGPPGRGSITRVLLLSPPSIGRTVGAHAICSVISTVGREAGEQLWEMKTTANPSFCPKFLLLQPFSKAGKSRYRPISWVPLGTAWMQLNRQERGLSWDSAMSPASTSLRTPNTLGVHFHTLSTTASPCDPKERQDRIPNPNCCLQLPIPVCPHIPLLICFSHCPNLYPSLLPLKLLLK